MHQGKYRIASIMLDKPDDIKVYVENEKLLATISELDIIIINTALDLPYISKSLNNIGSVYYYTDQDTIDSHLESYKKEIERLEGNIEQSNKKLNNPLFLDHAPNDIIVNEVKKRSDFKKRLEEQKLNIERVSK